MKALYYILFTLFGFTEFSMIMQLFTGKREVDISFIAAMGIIAVLGYLFFSLAYNKESSTVSTEIGASTIEQSLFNQKADKLGKSELSTTLDIFNLNNLLLGLKEVSLNIEAKEFFIGKSWVLVNEPTQFEKLIFKKNGDLILSSNGNVTIGNWEYFPSSNSLLIDRLVDKMLLSRDYIDNAVMILKKDGQNGTKFILVNEQLIPNLDYKSHLKKIYYSQHRIAHWILIDGSALEVYNTLDANKYNLKGSKVTLNLEELKDCILETNRGSKVEIVDSRITKVYKWSDIRLMNGTVVNIQYDLYDSPTLRVPLESGNKIYKEDKGTPLENGKYQISRNQYIQVEKGMIL